ncbi:TOMM precursor leader peptide-binding protein [Streptomyces sp. AC563]|uniref:TOMM precursor leader peptide-binding protein n=1 Tax=Streptomyces buecherae TaxID=2763006 RepID=UPI00164DFC89|nr:TOMM precursor leader peptide-binding protein [Streptomyces buecherae]MBC3989705.1 TOMM precursor leader peptide-binding protein [Streptomyces buecherae]
MVEVDPDRAYRIKRYLSLVVHGPDHVELRRGVWNATSTVLRDDSGTGGLSRVITRLDGSATSREIATTEEIALDEVLMVVTSLVERDLVDSAAGGFLDHYLDMVQGRRAMLTAPTPVLVVGSAAIADPLVEIVRASLPTASIRRVEENHPLAQVTHRDADHLKDGLAFHRYAARFADLVGHFVVHLEGVVDPVRTQVINRVLRHHQVPWLHGAVDGPFVFVGPLVVPGRTPCWECYETRILLNLREGASYQGYKRAIAEGRTRAADRSVQPMLASLLAAHAAPEVLSWSAVGNAATLGQVFSLFTPTTEFSVHEILALPDCRACAPVPERDDEELYFDSGVLEEVEQR